MAARTRTGPAAVRDRRPGRASARRGREPCRHPDPHRPRRRNRHVPPHAASPQHIAPTSAAAAPRPGEQPVELRLNPEELGHVRLTLLQGDGSISVTIQAERGETLDLMRRHIAQLEAEFRQATSATAISSSRSAPRGRRAETWADNGQARSSAAPADPETAPEIVATAAAMPPASGARDGLDLRL
ncbi:MAG: flagellar hook-length control protein FliK [Paracoccaceae bacterium]